MRVEPASDSALFISFGDSISPAANRRVISLFNAIDRLRDSRIRNLHPAYSSLLIDFDPLRLSHSELDALLTPFLDSDPPDLAASRQVEIPVCYEQEFAPDLAFVSQHTGLTEEQISPRTQAATTLSIFLDFLRVSRIWA